MKRFLRDNGLSLAFGVLFLLAVVGQAIAGFADFNNTQDLQGEPRMSFGRYLTSSEFGVAVMENWQSEYLQFTLFLMLTVWLVQRGSPESKEPGKEGTESERDQLVEEHAKESSPKWAREGGFRTALYSNSLLLTMVFFWVGSWFAQAVTGRVAHNAELISHREDPLGLFSYLGSADFWERTLQNWQSEFLAVGSFVILAVYLRQRGSPESKPVGAEHGATGVEG